MSQNPILDKTLSSLPLFQGIEADLLKGLISSVRYAEHVKGDIFLEQDQTITRFYVVLNGWCGAVKINSGGQESVLQIFRHGDFLPEPNSASGGVTTSPTNLQALTPVYLAMFSPSLIGNALEQSKTFSSNMLAANNQRCNELRTHIETLTLHTAQERLGRFLLDLRLSVDSPSQEIQLPIDKAIIASYLGIKPETLSRTLKEFKTAGFGVDRNKLHMPNQHALCDYCDSISAQKCVHAHEPACPHQSDNVPFSS